jgi:enhancer of polycomb-like protein
MEEPTPIELDKVQEMAPLVGFREVARVEKSHAHPVAYRRRIGRLNRLWIDRRGMASPPLERNDDLMDDRWKYDQSSDDEEDQPMYELDPFDTRALKFRASIPLPPWMTSQRKQASQDQQQVLPNPGSRQALPPPPPPQTAHSQPQQQQLAR